MNIKTLQQVSNTQKKFFWVTVGAFFVFMFLYICFISISIVNVSVRQNLNDKIVALRSNVAQLEFQYVALQNEITTETAISKGYVNTPQVAYVTKESRLSFARP
jgi:hypothetical protein